MTFWGRHSHPPMGIGVKYRTAKRTPVSVGPAKFDLNRCNESPLRGEKPDFWPVSKNNTASLPLRGILPVIIKSLKLMVKKNHMKSHILSFYSVQSATTLDSSCAPIYMLTLKQPTAFVHQASQMVFRASCLLVSKILPSG